VRPTANQLEPAPVTPTLAGPASAPVRERDTDTLERVLPDAPWDVIVWDDPVNLMSYVVFVLRRVFGYPEPVARKLMLEVHTNGRSLVASEPREQAERYVQELHGYGLQATMERAS
jgi:ATP-dependent Clp protease adaptor protein ClpS